MTPGAPLKESDKRRVGTAGIDPTQDQTMEIFDSMKDVRVVIRTPWAHVLDTRAIELEVADTHGAHMLRADREPQLLALVPGEIVLRRRDGTEIHVTVSWGSLTAMGRQIRIVVERAKVRYVEPLRIAV
jgi:hypothetical protein